jgi:hypothetical protein
VLEPGELFRWCGKRVEVSDARVGRNEVILTAKEEEHRDLERRHQLDEIQPRDLRPHRIQ